MKVAKLGENLAGSRQIFVNLNEGKSLVFLQDEDKNAPLCNHLHKLMDLQIWLEYSADPTSLCPSCTILEPILNSPKLISGKGDELEDQEMDDESQKSEDDIASSDEIDIPSWLIEAIESHYSYKVWNENMPTSLFVTRSNVNAGNGNIIPIGNGIFCNTVIDSLEFIGEYKGDVYFDKHYVTTSKSKKIISIQLLNQDIWVDARDYWVGFINHKWNWPYDLKELPSKWYMHFSNVRINEQGFVQATRNIKPKEELFFDYGMDYWTDENGKPMWSLSMTNGPDTEFETFLLERKRCIRLLARSIPVNVSQNFFAKLKEKACEYGILLK